MREFYKNTIIENINFDGYEDSLDILGVSMKEGFDHELYVKIHNVYHIFKREYGFMCERIGEYNAFKEWLQGLPSVLTVPFYNYDILENAKKAGFFMIIRYSSDEEPQEVMQEGRTLQRSQENFLNTYWDNLSLAFFNIKDELCEHN